MRIDHPYSLMVRDRGLAWSCGQCPLDANGEVLAATDLMAQTNAVAEFIEKIVSEMGMPISSIGKLVAYHAEDNSAERTEMVSLLRKRIGDDVLVIPIKVPHFYYGGMLIEVDIHASIDRRGIQKVEDERFGLRLEILDGGPLLWVSLISHKEKERSTGDQGLVQALGQLVKKAGLEEGSSR